MRNAWVMGMVLWITGMGVVQSSLAKTVYMPDDGASLSACFAVMQGGDTLIIRDGTYTGSDNRIDINNHPPIGTGSAWTIIKAEHDGEVLFDGQDARDMFGYSGSSESLFWQFEGIVWGHTSTSNVGVFRSGFVKFFRCGAFDTGIGNTINFLAGRESFDVLFENCFAWGGGRYKFAGYQADRIIFRTCVARHDVINATGEPVGSFTMYSVDDGEVQNCIAVDSDQTEAWLNVGEYAGAFCVPCTDMDTNRIHYDRCVALNVKVGGMKTSRQGYDSRDITFTDCVLWDVAVNASGSSVNLWRGSNNQVYNCTFGETVHDYFSHNSYDCCGENNTTFMNNIIYHYTGGTIFYDVENEDYNALYNNDGSNQTGVHDLTTTNPIWNVTTNPHGALKYIVRLEEDSNLKNMGEDNADIGANVEKLVGAPGTLWGEAGYNQAQTTSMWPYPYEALIKRKMQTYSGTMNGVTVTGARGFCAANETLTHYIWNYLGNGGCPYAPADSETSPTTDKPVVVYPNPASGDKVTIEIATEQLQEITLSVYNIAGERVLQKKIAGSRTGVVREELAIRNLAKGIYLARVTQNGASIGSCKFAIGR